MSDCNTGFCTIEQGFNYEALDVETRVFVRERVRDIRTIANRVAQDYSQIGQNLIEVKQRLNHGHWLPWLAGEFGWSERTAQRYIRVAEVFGNQAIEGMTLTALDVLASASVPESARAEALSLAAAGEPINRQTAEIIKAKHGIQRGDVLPVHGTNSPLDGQKLTVESIDNDFVHGSINGEKVSVLPGHLIEPKPQAAPRQPTTTAIDESAEFWRSRCLQAESIVNAATPLIRQCMDFAPVRAIGELSAWLRTADEFHKG